MPVAHGLSRSNHKYFKLTSRRSMATYEFHCHRCDLNFALMFSFGQYRKKIKPIRCPNCGSTRIERRISIFEVKTSKKS